MPATISGSGPPSFIISVGSILTQQISFQGLFASIEVLVTYFDPNNTLSDNVLESFELLVWNSSDFVRKLCPLWMVGHMAIPSPTKDSLWNQSILHFTLHVAPQTACGLDA
jgi:hypothetical protein